MDVIKYGKLNLLALVMKAGDAVEVRVLNIMLILIVAILFTVVIMMVIVPLRPLVELVIMIIIGWRCRRRMLVVVRTVLFRITIWLWDGMEVKDWS